ncbi:Hypothetical protein EPM1_0393 [Stenotrophomonas maltophilia EPM1]|nr:Hypothetical protein EPM1_0393 [Stenotrophomonas maltophilia EPM1]
MERHSAIVEPCPCSAASGTAEHGLGSRDPQSSVARHYKKLQSVQVLPEGIRRGYRPLSAPPADFPFHTASCRMGAARFSACS